MDDIMETLRAALETASFARHEALRAARAAYPIGVPVIVRTQRWGYSAREHAGVVMAVGVHVHHFGTSVEIKVRNEKTGKVTTRYPGIDVDGLPQVRLAESEDERNG